MRRPRLSLLAVILLCAGVRRAAGADAPSGPVMELPPVVVETNQERQDWQYVQLPGYEFLSLCQEDQTETFIAGIMRAHQVLRLLLPDALQGHSAVPTEFILYPQSKEQSISGPVLAQMNASAGKVSDRSSAVTILPGLRIDDDDSTEVFALINDDGRPSDASWLAIQPGYVEYLIGTRIPAMPAWLHAGLIALYTSCDVGTDSIRVPPITWVSGPKTDLLREDPDAPRTLLPLAELFRPDAPARDLDAYSADRHRVWLAEAALFIRWAHDDGQEARIAAFRRFAVRSCEGNVTEAEFKACFGYGYAQMRDILSDYLPTAVREGYVLRGDQPAPPVIRVREPSRATVARIRGDWERRAAKFMRARSVPISLTYAAQAKLSFQHALAEAPNDPAVLAGAGIAAYGAGDRDLAEPLLRKATSVHASRPDAYLDLARIVLDRAIASSPNGSGKISTAQRTEVEQIAVAGLGVEPRIPDLFGLLSDVQFRTEKPGDGSVLALIDQGAHLYQNFPVLVFRAAVLEGYYGNQGEAKWLVARALEHDLTAPDRLRFEALKVALGRPLAP